MIISFIIMEICLFSAKCLKRNRIYAYLNYNFETNIQSVYSKQA